MVRKYSIDISQPAYQTGSSGSWMFNQEEFIVKHHNFSFEFVEHWTVEIGFPCYDTRIWSKIYQKILVPYPFQLYCFDRFGARFLFQTMLAFESCSHHFHFEPM